MLRCHTSVLTGICMYPIPDILIFFVHLDSPENAHGSVSERGRPWFLFHAQRVAETAGEYILAQNMRRACQAGDYHVVPPSTRGNDVVIAGKTSGRRTSSRNRIAQKTLAILGGRVDIRKPPPQSGTLKSIPSRSPPTGGHTRGAHEHRMNGVQP